VTDVVAALNGLGLSEPEIIVYQAALITGARPASVIAKKAGLKRAHTYNILEGLKEKGFVQETIKNGVRHYSPIAPTSLLVMMENQIADFVARKKKLESIIPVLENIQNSLGRQARVRLFQGKEGIREVFEDILRSGHDMYSLVDLQNSWSSVDDESRHWVKSFITRREQQGITWYAIAVRSEVSDSELKWRSASKRKVKMLEGVRLPAEINVYGHKVALTSTKQEMIGALIENEPIAETVRNLHQFIWKMLPDYKIEK
jgi:sugar-specific transcriptional regulator TrmB